MSLHAPFQPMLGARSFRVVKDDSDGVAHARSQSADAVPQVDAIIAVSALDRPIVDGEGNPIALAQRHHFGTALHARALFGEHEFAAVKIPPRLGEQDCDLKWESQIAIEVLMQAIEIAGHILEQQRRRARLTGIVALLQKSAVPVWVSL